MYLPILSLIPMAFSKYKSLRCDIVGEDLENFGLLVFSNFIYQTININTTVSHAA